MERVLDGVILTVMGVILMTLLTRFFWSTFSPALIVLIIVAWIFMISFLIIPVLAIRYPERTKEVLMKLVHWLVPKFSWWSELSPETLVNLANREIDNLFGSMIRFTGTARAGLLGGGITTGLFWVTEFLVASVIMMGLGLGPAIVESFFFQILIAIINMIPLTPGSSGVIELSTSSLYALLIPTGMIGIFVLLWRFVTFYLNIVLEPSRGLPYSGGRLSPGIQGRGIRKRCNYPGPGIRIKARASVFLRAHPADEPGREQLFFFISHGIIIRNTGYGGQTGPILPLTFIFSRMTG